MSLSRIVPVVLALLMASTVAHGQFVLTRLSGTHSFTSVTEVGGEWHISISSTSASPFQTATCILSTTNTNIAVGSISVSCNGTVNMIVNESSGGTFNYIADVSGSLTTGSQFWVSVFTTGDIGRPGGSPSFGTISGSIVSELSAGGDLVADVISGPRAGGGASTISNIVVGGDLTGDISALFGRIQSMSVAGDIGSSGNEIAINARDGIDEIIADAIYADINAQANSGSGSLHRLETTVGNFEGSLSTEFLIEQTGVSSPGIYVAGDLEAPITVDQDIRQPIEVDGDLDASITVTDQVRSRIVIGGSLVSGRTISAQALTEAGINGQVIINANNASGTWAGNVVVNGTTLATKPYYSNAALGGGVGLAPFHLHDADCTPANGGVSSGPSLVLRFYGPVTWDDQEFPFVISYCDGEDCQPGVQDDLSNWSVASGRGTRTVTITRSSSFPAVWHSTSNRS